MITWKPFSLTCLFLIHAFFPFEIVHLQSIFLCLSKHFPGDCAFWLFINFFLKIFIFSWTLWIFLCFSFCMFATKTSWFWEILCFAYVWSENPYLLVNKTPALTIYRNSPRCEFFHTAGFDNFFHLFNAVASDLRRLRQSNLVNCITFALFFILHVCHQNFLVLRNLVFFLFLSENPYA